MGNSGVSDDAPVNSFAFVTTRHADFRIAEALSFLGSSPGGIEAMERFNDQFEESMNQLCHAVAEEVAESGRYNKRVDIPASAYHARPTYRLDLQTTKKRTRRSGTGLWYVYYTIVDTDNDGKPDRINVVSVEHSSAQPYAINTGQFDTDVENDE